MIRNRTKIQFKRFELITYQIETHTQFKEPNRTTDRVQNSSVLVVCESRELHAFSSFFVLRWQLPPSSRWMRDRTSRRVNGSHPDWWQAINTTVAALFTHNHWQLFLTPCSCVGEVIIHIATEALDGHTYLRVSICVCLAWQWTLSK